MKVKELLMILKDCDENSEVRLTIESGMGSIGSDDFGVNVEDDGVVYFSGEEDHYE